MDLGLKGRVAVITGGSKGIGKAIARGLAAEGVNIVLSQNTTKSEFVTGFCKRMGILSGRWAEMDEVADTVTFLASDRARYINGANNRDLV